MPTQRRSYSGSRPYSIPRKYRRAYRSQRTIRRMYPPSKFGYMAVPRSEQTRARFGLNWRRATPEQRQARIGDRYYGRGSYWSKAWKHILKPIGKAALRGALGGAKSHALGMLTGSGMYTGDGMYTGSGSYEPVSNDLVAGGDDSVAEFASANDETGSLHITNKEYISEIYGNPRLNPQSTDPTAPTQPFVARAFSLNPGVELPFPWLSQVAANYEEFEFKQLIYTYKSQVQDINSSNGQCGTVIMATLYNPNLPAFNDKSSMLQYAHSSSAKSTDDMIHGVECDPEKLSGPPGHYVRTGPVGTDLTNYDHGTFVLGVSNTPAVLANAAIGELWVSYTVVLRKPKVVSGKGLTISRFMAVTRNETLSLSDTSQSTHILGSTGVGATENVLCTARKNSLPLKITSTMSNLQPFTPARVGAPCYGGNRWNPTRGTLVASPSASDEFQAPIGGAGAAYSAGVTIPASYSGALKVQLMVEVHAPTPDPLQNLALSPPVLFGNVAPLYDIYAAGTENSDSPGWMSQSMGGVVSNSWYQRYILIFHIYVEPASNNVDNGFFWYNTNGNICGDVWHKEITGTVNLVQTSLDVSEYNYSLSEWPAPGMSFINPDGTTASIP